MGGQKPYVVREVWRDRYQGDSSGGWQESHIHVYLCDHEEEAVAKAIGALMAYAENENASSMWACGGPSEQDKGALTDTLVKDRPHRYGVRDRLMGTLGTFLRFAKKEAPARTAQGGGHYRVGKLVWKGYALVGYAELDPNYEQAIAVELYQAEEVDS